MYIRQCESNGIVRVRVRVSDFWSNSFIEFESNGDRNKTLSVEEYLNKMRQYLTLSRMGFFGAAHGWGGSFLAPPS